MISSLWIAKTGLDAQQTNMDVIANNLANVSTNGFKRQRAVFEDLLYQTIRQPGAQSSEQTTLPSGLQIGTGVRPVATERLHSQGNLSQTNNSKDVAIKGQGFFQVMLPDGTSAYTRDGSFQVDQNGQLVTAGGFQVQPAITIPANSLSITIGRDGIVSVTQQGQAAPVQVGQLNLTTFMNDTGLESIGENLYTETQSSGAPNESTPGLNGAGLLYQGYVETSNVNVAEELVNMIQVQRAYEINSKAVSTTDQTLQKLTQLQSGVRWGENPTDTRILKMTAMRKYALHPYPILALLVVSLTGCAWIPATPLVQGATTAQPVPGPTPVANGSIFQSAQPINYGYQPLFEDRRPRNIGDTLTIVLQENVSASKSSSANASRDGKTNFGFDTVPRYLQGLFGNERADVEASGGNSFNGKGGANARNTFSGTLTVTVDQVLVNGNLHVVGEKQIAINQGTEFIRFSGVVNPRTISGSNSVPSTQVADARIEYVGNGYINEAQNMGWLQRFFLNLSPM